MRVLECIDDRELTRQHADGVRGINSRRDDTVVGYGVSRNSAGDRVATTSVYYDKVATIATSRDGKRVLVEKEEVRRTITHTVKRADADVRQIRDQGRRGKRGKKKKNKTKGGKGKKGKGKAGKGENGKGSRPRRDSDELPDNASDVSDITG
jgi:hypothetical protein